MITSTVNLTMSCISTVFSTYGGGARGYSLQSYSSIRFYDGSYGPAEPPINMSSFREKAAWIDSGGTQTFTASGTFTVPSGVTSLNVELRGAIGRGTENGGFGGLVSGTLAVTSGETLIIKVNYQGGESVNGDAGGGMAAIYRTTTIVVAAGGGGGSGGGPTFGGNGGSDGADNGNTSKDAEGGRGATVGEIGNGGTYTGTGEGANGSDGASEMGGAGAEGGGGGGGGGYFGGGGGAYDASEIGAGGGGGGSSYVANLTGTVINIKGDNSTIANGNVVLTWT
jgi:hypothetical protein